MNNWIVPKMSIYNSLKYKKLFVLRQLCLTQTNEAKQPNKAHCDISVLRLIVYFLIYFFHTLEMSVNKPDNQYNSSDFVR